MSQRTHPSHQQCSEWRLAHYNGMPASHSNGLPANPLRYPDLSELGIRVAQWTNHRWSMEDFKSTSVLGVFIFRASTRPIGMSLPRIASSIARGLALDVFIHLYTNGISFLRWIAGVVPPNKPQTTLPRRTPRGVAGLTVSDDDSRCWINATTASI